MNITKISLTNFRNFHRLSVDFDSKGCLIFGKNGVGKSNLLEAITYFSLGKSVRNSPDEDIISFEKDSLTSQATFVDSDSSNNLDFGLFIGHKAKKLIKFNGKVLDKISRLYSLVRIVYFSSFDIFLIQGAPSLRRGFLDRQISQISQEYLHCLIAYKKVLAQRNRLLKIGYAPFEKKLWDEQFASAIVPVLKHRFLYIREFNKQIKTLCPKLSSKPICLKYKCSCKTTKKEKLRESIFRQLEQIKEDEKYFQRSLIGPHLDDIVFLFDGKSAKDFASFGQKKLALITSKINHAHLLQNKINQTPILIFDDILSELDVKNRTHILKVAKGEMQLFIASPTRQEYLNELNFQKIDLEKKKVS